MTTTRLYYRQLWEATAPPPPPPPPPPPYRTLIPFLKPFPSDQFYNVPLGAGNTVYAASDPRTARVRISTAGINYVNWTDPHDQAVITDPFCDLEFRKVLPAGWNTLTKSQLGPTGATTTTYPIYTRVRGLRIPTSTTWEGTTNVDRKVIVNQGFAVTLTIDTYINNVFSSSRTESYAAGKLNIEMHNFYRTTGSAVGSGAGTKIYCTNLSMTNIADDYGLLKGAIASGISPSQGYVRSWQVGLMASGDNFAIKNSLKVGGPLSTFKWDTTLNGGAGAAAIRWPARTADGHATAANYTGPLEYGSQFSLPAAFNVNTFVESRVATAYWSYCKSMLNALKYFGANFLITAGTSGANTITYGFEPQGNLLTSAQVAAIKLVLDDAHDYCEVSSNYHSVGTLRADRQPIGGVGVIAGGGARRNAGLGWVNYDANGLLLPLNPAGPWI